MRDQNIEIDKNNLTWCIDSLREKLYSLPNIDDQVDSSHEDDKLSDKEVNDQQESPDNDQEGNDQQESSNKDAKLSDKQLFIEYTTIVIMLCAFKWYGIEKKPYIPLYYRKKDNINKFAFLHDDQKKSELKDAIKKKVNDIFDQIKQNDNSNQDDDMHFNKLAAIIAYYIIHEQSFIDEGEGDDKTMTLSQVKEKIQAINRDSNSDDNAEGNSDGNADGHSDALRNKKQKEIADGLLKRLYQSEECSFFNHDDIKKNVIEKFNAIVENNLDYLIVPKEKQDDFKNMIKNEKRTTYVWRTELNGKVREYHHCLDGMVFFYDIDATKLEKKDVEQDMYKDPYSFLTYRGQDKKPFTLHKAGHIGYRCQCRPEKIIDYKEEDKQ